MFSRLLVPLDGSPEAAVALAPVRALAAASGATIRLLRVVPGGRTDEVAPASANLAAVAGELTSGGAVVTTRVRQGAPAEEIVVEAQEVAADLVVMATHGRSGLGRAVLGSVADGVVTTSPVPVLLLRPGGHRTSAVKTLLVPIDGSPGGAPVVGVALGLARTTGARVVLLEVFVPPVSYGLVSAALDSTPYVDPDWDDEVRTSTRGYVAGMAERLRRAGVEAEGRVADAPIGTPSAMIAETIAGTASAVDADLIVMSTHALTGPARTVLGGVADAVVRGADRPVLLIRRGMRLPRIPHAAPLGAPPAAV